jgi:hypothetical protein
MAHFAEIDENGIVLRVIVVGNKDTSDENGVENEEIGKEFCQNLFGGNWVQTSYNRNIRKNFAGPGYTYDKNRDAFISPSPFPSWELNEETLWWSAPVPYPTDGVLYYWSEDEQNWLFFNDHDIPVKIFNSSEIKD